MKNMLNLIIINSYVVVKLTMFPGAPQSVADDLLEKSHASAKRATNSLKSIGCLVCLGGQNLVNSLPR